MTKSESLYGIRAGYRHRRENMAHDDRCFTDGWQREVYERAAALVDMSSSPLVYDVGCGSAYKLATIFGRTRTVGFELEPMVIWLRKTYPDREWRWCDLHEDLSHHSPDLVICADVVEHVPDPASLMHFLHRIRFTWLVLSTPDRDLLYGEGHKNAMGPPENPTHCREWTQPEMLAYASRWFDVVEQVVTNEEQGTQMLVCKRK